MKTLFCLFIGALAGTVVSPLAAENDNRCFEMRVYYAAPGKLDDLNARFRNHTTKLFEKHGMTNIGYWIPLDNPENKLVYLLAYPSREAREKSWKEFGNDPDWKAAAKASEANGRLVLKADVTFLKATDYSPIINPSSTDKPRCFELRTYTATPGKLDKLNARFREHTVALFKKHGMTQLGYWNPADKAKGGDDTLIYLLAHQSKEAAAESFKNFRADPAWISAKQASETDGALTTKVESVFMAPTDYSPIK